MHRARSIAAVLLLLAPTAALAGDDRPLWGGLGYMSQGWMMGDLSGLGEDLGLDAPPGIGVTLGGGGLALLGGRVTLKGDGYAIVGLDGEGTAASTHLTGGGGGLSVGVVVVNDSRMLIFPSLGAVGHGADLLVEAGTDPVDLAGTPLDGGERVKLTGGGWALDLGASMFFLPWAADGGGMTVGASMGYLLAIGGDPWEAVGGAATTLEGVPGGLYFRAHVGGGGASRARLGGGGSR